ncbi:hypothetical protein Ddc_22094 [Ditylenchus destructor]|nr:hypothetical protein Ddc_22094 [Ditylenchus destructor]
MGLSWTSSGSCSPRPQPECGRLPGSSSSGCASRAPGCSSDRGARSRSRPWGRRDGGSATLGFGDDLVAHVGSGMNELSSELTPTRSHRLGGGRNASCEADLEQRRKSGEGGSLHAPRALPPAHVPATAHAPPAAPSRPLVPPSPIDRPWHATRGRSTARNIEYSSQ